MTDDGRTHYALCWEERGHHDCAIAEIERLRAALQLVRVNEATLNGLWFDTSRDLQAERDRAERLRDALREYGEHDIRCRVALYGGTPYRQPGVACECGLDAALEGRAP